MGRYVIFGLLYVPSKLLPTVQCHIPEVLSPLQKRTKFSHCFKKLSVQLQFWNPGDEVPFVLNYE
jgi:hypothetical protein